VIVLDTNAVSEVMKPALSETVLRWFAAQEPLNIFVTVITQAEILYGIELMTAGRAEAAPVPLC
jgi:toxin FitB